MLVIMMTSDACHESDVGMFSNCFAFILTKQIVVTVAADSECIASGLLSVILKIKIQK
jgi:hypothetical protein